MLMTSLRQWFSQDSLDWIHRNYVVDWSVFYPHAWGHDGLTLARVFVFAFWLTSYLISFIPIFERDITLKDESITHKHTHEQ